MTSQSGLLFTNPLNSRRLNSSRWRIVTTSCTVSLSAGCLIFSSLNSNETANSFCTRLLQTVSMAVDVPSFPHSLNKGTSSSSVPCCPYSNFFSLDLLVTVCDMSGCIEVSIRVDVDRPWMQLKLCNWWPLRKTRSVTMACQSKLHLKLFFLHFSIILFLNLFILLSHNHNNFNWYMGRVQPFWQEWDMEIHVCHILPIIMDRICIYILKRCSPRPSLYSTTLTHHHSIFKRLFPDVTPVRLFCGKLFLRTLLQNSTLCEANH